MAHRHGAYSNFVRTHYRYSAVPIDAELFDEIASMADASMCDAPCCICDGSSDALNQVLDDIVPTLREELVRAGVSLAGPGYFEAVERNAADRSL